MSSPAASQLHHFRDESVPLSTPNHEQNSETQHVPSVDQMLRQELLLGNSETLKRVLAVWDARTLYYWRALCEAYGISSQKTRPNILTEDGENELCDVTAVRFISSHNKLTRWLSESALTDGDKFELTANTQLADILYVKSRVATELQALEQLRQELEDCEVPSEVHLKLEAAQKENATLRKKIDEFRNKLWDLAQYKVSKDQELEELREQHEQMVLQLKQQHETGLKSLQRMYEDEKATRTTSVLRALSESTGLNLSYEKTPTQPKTAPSRAAAGSFSQYSSLVVISDDEDDDFDLALSFKERKSALHDLAEVASDESPDESMAPDSLADLVDSKPLSKAISFAPEVGQVSSGSVPEKASKLPSIPSSDNEDQENAFVPREYFQRVEKELQSLRELVVNYERRLGQESSSLEAPTKPMPQCSLDSSEDGLSEKLRQLNDEVERWSAVEVVAHSSPHKSFDVSASKLSSIPLPVEHSIENWTFSLPAKSFGPDTETFSNISELPSVDLSTQAFHLQANNNAPVSPSSIDVVQHVGVNTELTLSGVYLSLESWQEALAKALCDGVLHSAVNYVEQEEISRAERNALLERMEAQNSETLTALENERKQLAQKVQALKDEIQSIQAAHEEKMRQLRQNYENQLDEKALELKEQIERLQNDNARLTEGEGDVVQTQMEELKLAHYNEIVKLTEEHQRELDRIEAEYQLEQRISEISRKKQVSELETALRTALEMKERTEAYDDATSTTDLSCADKLIQVSLECPVDSPLLHCLECLCHGCKKFGTLLQHVDDLQKYCEEWKMIVDPVEEMLNETPESQREFHLKVNSSETAAKMDEFPSLMESICQHMKDLLLNKHPAASESIDRELIEEDYRRRQANSDILLSQLQIEVDHLHSQLELETASHEKEVEDLKSQLQSASRQQKALERFVEEQTRDRELEREDYEKELSALRIQRQQMQSALRERKRSTDKLSIAMDKSTSVNFLGDNNNALDVLQSEHGRTLLLLHEKDALLETIQKELCAIPVDDQTNGNILDSKNQQLKIKSNRLVEMVCQIRDEMQRLQNQNAQLRKASGEQVHSSVDTALRLQKEKLATLSKDYEHLSEKHQHALQELDALKKTNSPLQSGKPVHPEPRETFGSRCSALLNTVGSNEAPASWEEVDHNKKMDNLSEIIREKDARISELEMLLAVQRSTPARVGATYDQHSMMTQPSSMKDATGLISRPQSSAMSGIAFGGSGPFNGLYSEFISNRIQTLVERILAEGQHLLTLADVDVFESVYPPQNEAALSLRNAGVADGCETREMPLEYVNLNHDEEGTDRIEESITLPVTVTRSHLPSRENELEAHHNSALDVDLEKERRALVAATSALKELLNRIEQWHNLRAYAGDSRAHVENPSSGSKPVADSFHNRAPGHEEDWRLSLLLAVQEAYTTDRELCAIRLESLLRSVAATSGNWGALQYSSHHNNNHSKLELDDDQDTLNDVNELTIRTPVQPPWLVLRDLLLQWQRQHQVSLDRLYSTDRQSLLAEINHLKQLVHRAEEVRIHPLHSSSPSSKGLGRVSVSTRDVSVSCVEDMSPLTKQRKETYSLSRENAEISRLKQQVEALTYRTKQAEEVSSELRSSYEREKLLNESLRDDRERLRRSLEEMRLRLSSAENRLSECRECLEEEQKLRFESLQSGEERRRSVNHLQHEIERVRRELNKCQSELNEERSCLLEEKRKAEILERELLLIIDRYKEDLRKEQLSSETERQMLQKRIATLQRDMEAMEKRASLSIKTGHDLRERALEENRILAEKNAELQMLLEEKTQSSVTQLREFEQLQRQVKKLRDDIEKKSADALSVSRQQTGSRHSRNSRGIYLGKSGSPANEKSSLINLFQEISPSSSEEVSNLSFLEASMHKYLEEVLFRVEQIQASLEEVSSSSLRHENSLGRISIHPDDSRITESDARGLLEVMQQVVGLRRFLLSHFSNANGFDGSENGPPGAYSGLSVTTLQYMITEHRNRANQGGLPHLELLPWELLFTDSHAPFLKAERQSSPSPVQKWQGPQLVYLLATMSAAQLQTQILLQASERLQMLCLVEQLEQRVSDFARIENSRQRSILSQSAVDRATQYSPVIVPERLSSQPSSNSLNSTMHSDNRSPNTSMQHLSNASRTYPCPAVPLKQHEEMHLRSLRAESRCRALAFQKRYLVLLLKQVTVTTLPTGPHFTLNYRSSKDVNEDGGKEVAYWKLPFPLKPLQRFRAVVCVSIALWRMRFQVNKWRFTANYFGLDSTQSSLSAARICIEPASHHSSLNRTASDVAGSGNQMIHRPRNSSPTRQSGRIIVVNESRNSSSSYQHSSLPMEHSNLNRISRSGRQSHSPPPLLHHPVSSSSTAAATVSLRRNISNAAQLRDSHPRFM